MTLTLAQKQALKLISQQKHTLLFGGSRSGKTFILCYALVVRALAAAGSRHVIFRFRFNAVKKSVGKDTMPKILKLMGVTAYQFLNNEVFILPNGSEIWLAGLDDKERVDKVLGLEFATIYFNECSEISYSAVGTALTRLAQKILTLKGEVLKLRVFYDCNPSGKSHWSYKVFVQKLNPSDNTCLPNPNSYGFMKINPADNQANLTSDYIDETLASLSERQKKRFLLGDFSEDLEGALWSDYLINKYRVVNAPADLLRIVVAIDPAVSCNEDSDETGLVVAGVSGEGHYYVLEDGSLKDTPNNWCHAAIGLYNKYKADRIIGEVNNGGDLIVSLLRTIDRTIPFREVRASKGKIKRAEPITALYEQGLVHHVGYLSKLEEQMCSYVPAMQNTSPDRMDALVWALTELSSKRSPLILA